MLRTKSRLLFIRCARANNSAHCKLAASSASNLSGAQHAYTCIGMCCCSLLCCNRQKVRCAGKAFAGLCADQGSDYCKRSEATQTHSCSHLEHACCCHCYHAQCCHDGVEPCEAHREAELVGAHHHLVGNHNGDDTAQVGEACRVVAGAESCLFRLLQCCCCYPCSVSSTADVSWCCAGL